MCLLDAGGGLLYWMRKDHTLRCDTQTTLSGLMRKPLVLGITNSGGRWSFIVGKGQAEVRAMDVPDLPLVYNYPIDAPQQIALAADGKRFAVVDQQGFIHTYSLPTPESTPGWRFKRLVSKLVEHKQYSKLDELFEKITQRTTVFPWNYQAGDYKYLSYVIHNPNPWVRKQLDLAALSQAWLKERPDSELALHIKIQLLTSKGWEARADGTADTVTEEGWKEFLQTHREAFELLGPTLKKDKPSPLAFHTVVCVAQAEGWNPAKLRPYIDRLEKLYPRDVFTHKMILEYFSPKWSGKLRDSEKHARQIAEQRGPGGGDAYYAEMASNMCLQYHADQVFGELGFDYERAQRGWKFVQEHDSRPHRGLLGALYFAFLKPDEPRLKALSTKVMEEKVPFQYEVFPNRLLSHMSVAEYVNAKFPVE
jgi:hypothetical protein